MLMENEHVRLTASGISDVGLRRASLEDAFFVSDEEGLYIISDGIGGAHGGALASAVTVQTLPLKLREECRTLRFEDATEYPVKARALACVIDGVKELLHEKTKDQPAAKGLGATVVAGFYLGDGYMALSHLGDSRAYLLRCGVLERLTEDHTLANMLFQTGRITKCQLAQHPARNILTRHIGMAECAAADAALIRLRPGDRLLFCTDGLTNMMRDAAIGQALAEQGDPAETCRRLVTLANSAGGYDNITVLVVDVLARQGDSVRRAFTKVSEKVGVSLTPVKEIFTSEDVP